MKRIKWPFSPRPISAVEPLAGRSLRITWDDGGSSNVDLADWIQAGGRIVAKLNDPALFAQAHVGEDGAAVEWIEDELTIDSIHLQLLESEQKGAPLLPESLKRWRKRHGLTQAEAAKALGVSPRMFQNYEGGRHFLPLTVALACRGWEAMRGKRAA